MSPLPSPSRDVGSPSFQSRTCARRCERLCGLIAVAFRLRPAQRFRAVEVSVGEEVLGTVGARFEKPVAASFEPKAPVVTLDERPGGAEACLTRDCATSEEDAACPIKREGVLTSPFWKAAPCLGGMKHANSICQPLVV